MLWSWALAAVGVTGLWLAGRKRATGWALGIAAQALWITYATATRQWGFYASAAAYTWVYALNWWRWTRPATEGDTPMDDQSTGSIHPATAQVLRHFRYSHLKPELAEVSKPFYDLAHRLADTLDGPELTVALRKLLESKDCAVRAAVDLLLPSSQ